MSQLSASGAQRAGASASVLTMNVQGWFPLYINNFFKRKSICTVAPNVKKVEHYVTMGPWLNALCYIPHHEILSSL